MRLARTWAGRTKSSSSNDDLERLSRLGQPIVHASRRGTSRIGMPMALSSETLVDPAQTISPASPHLPRIVSIGEFYAPSAPQDVRETGLDPLVLSNLALRAAYTVPQFTTEWAARRLHLPQPLVGAVLE